MALLQGSRGSQLLTTVLCFDREKQKGHSISLVMRRPTSSKLLQLFRRYMVPRCLVYVLRGFLVLFWCCLQVQSRDYYISFRSCNGARKDHPDLGCNIQFKMSSICVPNKNEKCIGVISDGRRCLRRFVRCQRRHIQNSRCVRQAADGRWPLHILLNAERDLYLVNMTPAFPLGTRHCVLHYLMPH